MNESVEGPSLNRMPAHHRTSQSVDRNNLGVRLIPVSFLLNYTDPSLESTSDAFITAGAHAKAVLEQSVYLTENCEAASYMFEGDLEGLFSGIFSDGFIDRGVGFNCSRSTALSPPQTLALRIRLEELISQLASQCEMSFKPYALPTAGFPMDLAKTVFTTENLTDYVSAYFSYVHPHFPFIHRPTFDIQTASLTLLLAVFLSGSAHSVPQDDALSARHFFNLAEEYIFRLLRTIVASSDQFSDDSVQTVQAALLIQSLQISFNNTSIRHRIRIHRRPDLVASIRSLGLTGIMHTTCLGSMNWEQFITKEIKVRYDECHPQCIVRNHSPKQVNNLDFCL